MKMPLVYIVDDEANIRQLAAFGLQDAGFETESFASGSEVLHAIHQRMPDALVLDWMMPPPDGLSVCRSIRENPSQRHLPILLLTARGEEGDRVFKSGRVIRAGGREGTKRGRFKNPIWTGWILTVRPPAGRRRTI